MATRRIEHLTLLYFEDRSYIGGGERLPLNWARGVVEASRGAYAVEIISFGAQPSCEVLYPGVPLRVLKATRRPANPLDVVSWELPAAIADADFVHIHQAFTRCSEMGLLAAKQQCKPVCVSDHEKTSRRHWGQNTQPLRFPTARLPTPPGAGKRLSPENQGDCQPGPIQGRGAGVGDLYL